MTNSITLADGKYTIINELNEGGGLRALRYNEEWRNLSGDNLILAAYHEIDRLQAKLNVVESLLSDAQGVMDDVHCYDTDTYHAISRYFDGEDSDDE